ncbi:hypothetical protein [Streptomyces xiaopingdaonensis]|uniref:hypothetical protein n=1 Tax=Streptomyces xiaopingdaonensis TaxID=1565415 RepID=UPI00031988A0|nr:hypothetical protein [Streptomyces xiaopingdaonensis]
MTLPDDLLAHARATSRGNLSAYVERALRGQQLQDAAPDLRAWRQRSANDTEELTGIFGEEIA